MASSRLLPSCRRAPAQDSHRVVLLLGACNILADAMAMGVGEYLSTKSSDEYARRERAREDWELRNHPEGEVGRNGRDLCPAGHVAGGRASRH